MSFKTLFVSVTALTLMSGAAMAAPSSWQGTFFVTEVTSQCATSGNTVGEFGTILYRPILNPGDSPEGLSLYFTRSAETIISQAQNGSFRGTTNYSGVEFGHSVRPNAFTGSSTIGISPANVSSSTMEITIKGHINNFFNNNPDCDVNFEATLLPRI